MLTTAMRTEMADYIVDNAGYAKIKAGTDYYQVNNISARLDETGRVVVSFLIGDIYPAGNTITEVQLYSKADALWATNTENILRRYSQEGIYYRFAFTLKQQ